MLFFPRIIRESRFAVIDVEATGVNQVKDWPVSIAIVQMDYGRVGVRAEMLIKPPIPIPPDATAIHGITNEMVMRANDFATIAGDIVGLIGDRCLLGYNVRSFDYPFLRRRLGELGADWDWRRPVFDLLHWVRKLDPAPKTGDRTGYHRLANVALRHGINPGQAHNALHDCRSTWSLFEKLATAYPQLGDSKAPTEPPPVAATKSNTRAAYDNMREVLEGSVPDDDEIPF